MVVPHNILSLDLGEKRVGVALANDLSRLPSPLLTLKVGDDFLTQLDQLIKNNDVSILVIGLPKNLNGQATSQTQFVEKFAEEIKLRTKLPVHFQDEALSSVRAEEDLKKSGKVYSKDQIDALAACFILEDFMNQQVGILHG